MAAPAAAVTPPVLDWTEKHRPQSLDDLVGNSKAIEELRAWAEAWKEGVPEERAVVLAGDPGVGKTSAAYALARDMGWGVIEMNASDQRNEEVIRRIAGSGARNRAFGADGSFGQGGGRQLVILDEADNLFGREDRGGLKAIVETIREARQPIVLIANDLYELQRRSSALKSLARTIKFTRVHSNSIPPALRRIAKREGVELEIGVDKAIAERAGGDLRSAVNDLQALATGRTVVTLQDVEALGRRDTTGDVWDLLGKVFYGADANAARKATWDLDETPEDLALWIDENLPVMYTDRADLVAGYRALSKASVFLGRVQRRQQYGLWSYASELMTAGVAVAKHGRPAGARFQFPSWLRRLSTSKAVRETRDATAAKVGDVVHTSKARARQDMFPYLKALMKEDERFAAWLTWRCGFEPEELAFLLEEKPASARVKRIMESAARDFGVPFRVLEAASAPAFGRYAEADGDDADEAPDEAKPLETGGEDDEDAPPAAAAPASATPAASTPEKADKRQDAKKPQRSLFEY
ncbi:MAG TPA: replication factor C large subunit [Candidatus Thermoplasmatota archaeon]|nr:replication factor C large subunit [Candidatus Thermoplasmatota archaeon]